MSPKTILIFCAQALLAQSAFSACLGGLAGAGLSGYGAGLNGYGAGLNGYGAGLNGYGAGCGSAAGVASTGGGLPVSSASPIAPVGVSVLSENCYEGQLSAGGNLPFLGTVGIEGVLPTAGVGAVSYGCGDGAAAIGSEGPIGTGILNGQTYAPSVGLASAGIGGLGGIAGYGLGAGSGLGGINGLGLGGISGLGLGGRNGYGLGGIAGNGRGNGCGC